MLSSPNKGAGMVLPRKSEYVSRMEVILNEKSKSTKAPTDNDKTHRTEKSLSSIMRRLRQKQYHSFERIRAYGNH